MIILSFMEHDGWTWLIVMFGSQQLYSKASPFFFFCIIIDPSRMLIEGGYSHPENRWRAKQNVETFN